jgi:hypothetical protein
MPTDPHLQPYPGHLGVVARPNKSGRRGEPNLVSDLTSLTLEIQIFSSHVKYVNTLLRSS